TPPGSPAQPRAPAPGPSGTAPPSRPQAPAPLPGLTTPGSPAQRPAPAPAPPPAARPVKAVQMHDLYLIVEVPEGVLVIDQHALHERVLFEQMKERLAAGALEAQRLLIPEPVSLAPAQAALVLEHREALAELA